MESICHATQELFVDVTAIWNEFGSHRNKYFRKWIDRKSNRYLKEISERIGIRSNDLYRTVNGSGSFAHPELAARYRDYLSRNGEGLRPRFFREAQGEYNSTMYDFDAFDVPKELLETYVDLTQTFSTDKKKRQRFDKWTKRVVGKKSISEAAAALGVSERWLIISYSGAKSRTSCHPEVLSRFLDFESGLVQDDGTDHIYFIRCVSTNTVKIGYTSNLNSRVRGLVSGGPEPFRFLGSVVGGRDTEAALHGRFYHLRVNGEWFRLTEELEKFLSETLGPSCVSQLAADIQPSQMGSFEVPEFIFDLLEPDETIGYLKVYAINQAIQTAQESKNPRNTMTRSAFSTAAHRSRLVDSLPDNFMDL